MNNDPTKLSKAIKDQALLLGFDACGIVHPSRLNADAVRLREWLDQGMNADMHYMQNHFEKRVDPRELMPGAKSVIVVLLNYYPSEIIATDDNFVISKYAYGIDYHTVLKEKLGFLQKFVINHFPDVETRIFVDSAPLLERSLAALAGLGWIGKNANLISQKLGSFVFIGEIITSLELVNDKPLKDHCGTCTSCIHACPTGAIISPCKIDSNLCISYWTIENKGPISKDLKDKIHNQIFGCDICQDVCPWNLKALSHNITEFQPSPELVAMRKKNWQNLDEAQFQRLFNKSAIKRAKFKGLKRNVDFLSN